MKRWLLIVVLALLPACSSVLTQSPKPVVAHQIAFDDNAQNAGVVGPGPGNLGAEITPGGRARYGALCKEFGRSTPQVTPYKSNFLITDAQLVEFAELQEAHRSGVKP